MSSAEHFRSVYRDGVEQYQQLVAHEDAAGLLWQSLDALVDWSGRRVVELGAGTGRLTVPLATRARQVDACDASPQMLAIAERRLSDAGLGNVTLHVAEHRSLPFADHTADALIEGWAVAHYVDWEPDTWASAVDACVAEMRRVVAPGDPIVLVETLGTGCTEPMPPTDEITALYEHLEARHGFTRSWVRTDYLFDSERAAVDTVTHFFGSEMTQHLVGASLPECTGIWSRLA